MSPQMTCASALPGKTGKHKYSIFYSNAVGPIITGSIARSATRRYLSYSEADFEIFRPLGATRIQMEVKFGKEDRGRDRRSHLPRHISPNWPHSVSLRVGQSHSVSLSVTQSHSVSLSLGQSHVSISLTQGHSVSLSLGQSQSVSFSLTQVTQSVSLTPSHSVSFSLTQGHSVSQYHSVSLSLIQSHSGSLSFT